MKRYAILVAFAAFACVGSAKAQTVDTMADCTKVVDLWRDLYNKGDADGLAALYAPNGTYSNPWWTASSRAAILQGFKAEMAGGTKFTAISCSESHRTGSLDYAAGPWSAVAKGPDGKDMTISGHWLSINEYHDGKYAVLIHSGNLQMPPPAPK